MRLYEITEPDSELDKLIAKIKADAAASQCSKALKLLRSGFILMHNGRYKMDHPDPTTLITIGKRSKPVSTPMLIHNLYNSMLTDLGKPAYRESSFFCYVKELKDLVQEKSVGTMICLPSDDSIIVYSSDNSTSSTLFVRANKVVGRLMSNLGQRIAMKHRREAILEAITIESEKNSSIEDFKAFLKSKFEREYPVIERTYIVPLIDFIKGEVDSLNETSIDQLDMDDLYELNEEAMIAGKQVLCVSIPALNLAIARYAKANKISTHRAYKYAISRLSA